ncbi:hypothetical protein, partial [Saccharicrinis fermentans]|uniref:hypothetical protein n=1 Tax=Saccharicrinis fermentans TaxID=982 RepID=UPI001F1BB7E5
MLAWRVGKVAELLKSWICYSCVSHLIDIFHLCTQLSVKDRRAGQNNSPGAGGGEKLEGGELVKLLA